jgi:glycolate oxidase FAD binding subunit
MTAASIPHFAPASIDEFAGTLRELAMSGEVIELRGGGTKAGWGNPVRDRGAEVSTAGLNRIVEYAPEDLVVTAEAGMRLADLQAALGAHGQRLAFDPPDAAHATIGGLVASNDFGQRRVRYGGIRDLILGVRIVRADGALVRGGGKVVKNVAGFDLPKIVVGSFGTLGAIVAATFRLHPVPETARMVAARGCSAPDLAAAARAAAEAQLEPAVLLAVREDGAYTVALVFEGFASGVDEQTRRAVEELGRLGLAAEAVTPEERARIHAAHGQARAHGDVRVKIAAVPGQIETIERDAIVPLAAVLGDPVATIYPSLGIAFAGGTFTGEPATAGTIAGARAASERCGGTLVLRDLPAALRGEVDPWGEPPPSFFLMERLKERFDPLRRLNRGRFVGGL